MPDDRITLPVRKLSLNWKIAGWIVGGVIVLMLAGISIVKVSHHGRLLPGARAYGVYLGGMTDEEATKYLSEQTQRYIDNSTVVINSESLQGVSVSAKEVALSYDVTGSVERLSQIGRQGQLWQQLIDQTNLMLGSYHLPDQPIAYDSQKLFAVIAPVYSRTNTPSQNASLEVQSGSTQIIAETDGQRLHLARFVNDLGSVWQRLENSAVTIQAQPQPAAVNQARLQPHLARLDTLSKSPLRVAFQSKSWAIPVQEVLAWYSHSQEAAPRKSDQVHNYYGYSPASNHSLTLNTSRISQYLQGMAREIDQTAVDAQLTIAGGRASVFKQSRDGRTLDVQASAQRIIDSLAQPQPAREPIALSVDIQPAAVSDATIDQLGIKELLSEGVSYFPGSSANRITNVRVGASRYQGVLLKPGEIFSFGKLLGEVGPAQGYKEGTVILEGRQESEYGGGLCQVSSTAFRAALLAGLQIVERHNHSFAVDYYTAPYGVPGVDATIYYPMVDFKFKNDTKNHILIQTEMVGTTLKFRFYGTKEKEGVIRGPNFIYGNSDPNQPSRTVFYRDIKVNGQVVKTDTFYTNYRSAADFPRIQ